MNEILDKRMLARWICAALVLGVLLSDFAFAQGALDRVRRRTGVDTGKVTRMSALEVTVTKNGVENKVPVEEIESIYFGGEPSQFSQARQAIARDNPQDALEKLKEINPESLARSEVRQELDYLIILAREQMVASGDSSLSTLIKLTEDFLSGNRKSYHVSAVIEIQGNAHLAAGESDEALRLFRKLAKAPSPYFQARSAILIGKVLQQSNEHQQALARFDTALVEAKKSPAAEQEVLEATLYRAISQSALGNVEQATKTVKEIITEAQPDDIDLLAVAYNALGDCYLQSGDQKAARDAYLHVDVLFSSNAEQHAKALFELGKLWTEFGHEQRSRTAREQLQSQYPSSPWAQR